MLPFSFFLDPEMNYIEVNAEGEITGINLDPGHGYNSDGPLFTLTEDGEFITNAIDLRKSFCYNLP